MANMEDVINIMVNMELESQELYKTIAAGVPTDVASLCLQFAEEEASHAEQFKLMGLAAGQAINWELIPIELLKPVSKPNPITKAATTRELITWALQQEQLAMELYQNLQEKLTSSTELTKVFDHIIQMERNHQYQILKILHSY